MPSVPRLTELCKRVLQSNVASLVDVGDIPYDMLRDVLPGCRVEQLREIEDLSPHIAEEDEEIWETFFKRDFPLVAEARKSQLGAVSNLASSSNVSHSFPPAYPFEDPSMSMFVTYRDLYYNEQVAREERLASAGTRLKERIASIKQQKQERRVVVDPRLGFDRARRRTRVAMREVPHWTSKDYKSKSLMEKARIRAGAIALAYHPPVFTRKSSMRIAINDSLPTKAKPNYAIDKEVEVDSQDGPTPKGKEKTNGTKFVERTIRPRSALISKKPDQVIGSKSSLISDEANYVTLNAKEQQSNGAVISKKIIPGITRRPKPVKRDLDCSKDIAQSATTEKSTLLTTIPDSKDSLQVQSTSSHLQSKGLPPMLHTASSVTFPVQLKRPPPSLFMPPKRPKLS